jgi:two-component system alkaline phosphatase synthesis response regulator PhoP
MIFCVEDDNSIRELMLYTLKASGFEAFGFEDGAALFTALEGETPELILLDIMLPGEDGISILKKLRAHSSIPVIMATAKGTEYDKVVGLDGGADDYLVKPFGMMEMVSRIKAVLRRTALTDPTLRMGDLALNTAAHTVCVGSQRVSLTLKEFELLRLFLSHPGRAYSRDELLALVWEADFAGETRTVDVHIGTLRTKLGACGSYIQTVRGVGYRMEEKA